MIKKYKLKNWQTRFAVRTYLGIDEITGKQIYYQKKGFISRKRAELDEIRAINQ